jgi:hypothetical protein
MAETVTNECGFDEAKTTADSTPMKETRTSLTSQLTDLKTSLITDNNSKCEEELKLCKSQFDSIKGIYEELDAKRNESSAIQLKDMREMVELKVQEIRKLSRELEAKQTENIEQAHKINNLEEKVRILSESIF